MLNDGASVVICGAPNAGKSTLLNSMAGFDRAITGPRPGTTRDVVSASISIGGIPVMLIDTAGLRVSKNKIEQEGVRRAKKEIENADCVLVLTPTDEPMDGPYINVSGKPSVHVISKSDLCSSKNLSYAKDKFPDACIVSAKTSFGISGLLGAVQALLGLSPSFGSLVPVITGRQNTVLKIIARHVQSSIGLLSVSGCTHFDLIAFELHCALKQVDLILGKTTTDDILENVFSSFCVGK